jgi:RNA polymerase sigma-70 factor (ECF subfamily)
MTITSTKPIVHQDLIIRCKKRDQKAQMEIYKLYYKAMYNTSLNIVGNTAEAEDIMQEAFLKAFRLLPDTELVSGFGGWLKKIVINKSLDVVRKRKVHFEEVDEIRDDMIDESSFESQGESVNEKILRVKRAMLELPEKYRTVLSLNLFEGYDHDEISGLLGISSSTSRAQLSRGKQKLVSLLNN